jgi:amidase
MKIVRNCTWLIFLFSFSACFVTSQEQTDKDFNKEFSYLEFDIEQIRNGYENGEFTIEEVVEAYLDRIQTIDREGPGLNSIIQTNPDALNIARQLDEEWKNGNIRGPMHGIPIILKDNIDTHDAMNTTAGSRVLEGSKAPEDSWVAARLKEAGAIIIGKANLSEWANFRGRRSTSGWSGVGGQTKNPYFLDRNPCGSSSGSGVAVSANLCILAIGTETNGSIVCPSSANGVVGIKPTVGLISRSGIIPISYTQDTPGPMARSVKDAAICLGVLTGVDQKDAKTGSSEGNFQTDYTAFLDEKGLEGKRIGWLKSTYGSLPKVDALIDAALEDIRQAGATIIEIEQLFDPAANGWSFEVMLYEYKDGLNNYFAGLGENAPVKDIDELIKFNVQDSISLKYFGQEYLIQAAEKGALTEVAYQDALTKMLAATRENGIDKVLKEYQLDAIVAPTGAPAWKTDPINGDHYLLGSSSAAAISGYPNITVPMGQVEGLPVGISFFGTAWSEPLLLSIAYSYEQKTRHRFVPEFKN